eukprot:TRINITY_DN6414_c0_g3_i1.p1 TRINITY_DN6414_c0_g3~~TRINITY_DN6414_c0_g3_i1.p1  ORF type:complete len:183 (+),score=16.31 TRINITY_DN6414_c0_g3_i1:147-695(+)
MRAMILPRLLASRHRERPNDLKSKQRSTLVERVTRQLNQSSCVCSLSDWEECYSAFPRCTETSCCICLSDIDGFSRIRGLGCGHVFHLACISEWFMQDKSLELACPLCRVPLAKQPAILKSCTSNAPRKSGSTSPPVILAQGEECNFDIEEEARPMILRSVRTQSVPDFKVCSRGKCIKLQL